MAAIGKTKEFSSQEFIRILLDNGFEYSSCKGDHKKFRRGKETVVVNKKLNKMVARRLLKEHNLMFR